MKTFYIAARPKYRTREVEELSRFLIGRGLGGTFNWVESAANGEVKMPYIDNPKESADIGDRMMQAVYSADIFILLHDEDLEGALMEYGVARYTAINNSEKLILVVNMKGRDSIFLHRENIILFESIEQLEEWVIENL